MAFWLIIGTYQQKTDPVYWVQLDSQVWLTRPINDT